MRYTPTKWIDGETPVNAENLNKLERGVQNNAAAVDEINAARAAGEFKGEKGDTGDTGAAGVSVSSVKQTTTSSADGGSNVVTVTLSDGTTSTFTVKNGSKGSTGATGATGPKPVKGTDYWTAADQEAIVQQVIAALGTPVFGRVDADNNIILTGELADGTYTFKYEDAEGNVTEIGTIDTRPGYTNWIPISTDTDGTIYNGIGYKVNTRYSSGSGTDITHNGCYITGYIPVTINTVICIADMTMDKNSADGNMCFAYLFDTNKANAKKIQVNTGGAYTFDGLGAVWDNNGYLTQFTAPADGFVRLQASYIGADSVITLE